MLDRVLGEATGLPRASVSWALGLTWDLLRKEFDSGDVEFQLSLARNKCRMVSCAFAELPLLYVAQLPQRCPFI